MIVRQPITKLIERLEEQIKRRNRPRMSDMLRWASDSEPFKELRIDDADWGMLQRKIDVVEMVDAFQSRAGVPIAKRGFSLYSTPKATYVLYAVSGGEEIARQFGYNFAIINSAVYTSGEDYPLDGPWNGHIEGA